MLGHHWNQMTIVKTIGLIRGANKVNKQQKHCTQPPQESRTQITTTLLFAADLHVPINKRIDGVYDVNTGSDAGQACSSVSCALTTQAFLAMLTNPDCRR